MIRHVGVFGFASRERARGKETAPRYSCPRRSRGKWLYRGGYGRGFYAGSLLATHFFLFQVKKIASIFKIAPHTLYLVEEVDNAAVFPDDLGKFKTSQLSDGVTYEVHGDEMDSPSMEQHNTSQPSSPYGAYTGPVCSTSKLPIMHTTSKSKSLRRAISLVSLTGVDPTKPCSSKAGKFEYTIVTQLYVCLTPDQCNVSCVTDLLSKQVGFSVILLDCKCYPLPSTPATCGLDFWKGTRKVLAASKSLFSQLSDDDIPQPKKQKQGEALILKKLEVLENRISVPVEVRKALQCTICHVVASPPIVYSCCQRVVACTDCNTTWRRERDRCPLCNTALSASTHYFELKGFDDVTRLIGEGSVACSKNRTHETADTDSSDEFETMRTFRVTTN